MADAWGRDAGMGSHVPDANAPEGSGTYDGGAPEGAVPEAGAVGAPPGWTLTWSDEFNGPDGSPVDPSKWVHEVGGGGGGNNEREYYTDGTANAVIQGGNLVITARADGASQYSCWYGSCQYTSARLNTLAGFTQQYGRFEARIQVPSAQGMWPAFWMMGSNYPTVNWPACGEIDILETVNVATSAHGSLHSIGFDATGGYMAPGMVDLGGAFHTYTVEWDATTIQFLVDDQVYETHVPGDAMNAGGQWPFDQPFFLILNLAVGGKWPGDPDNSTTFPQVMKVDWVRVYSKS